MISQVVQTARLAAMCVATVLLAGGCAGNGQRDAPAAPPATGTGSSTAVPPARHRTLGEEAAIIAVRQVGVPYRYGGNDASGFDCSGLVQFAYAGAGKNLPRTTSNLWRSSRAIEPADLRVGDLLFFRIAGKMSHVGMYIGSRRFVHAPSTGSEVTIADLDSDFYRRALLRAGRPY